MVASVKIFVYKNNKDGDNDNVLISQKRLYWTGDFDFTKEKFFSIIDKLYNNGFLVTKNTGAFVVMQNENKTIHLYLAKA